MELWVRSQDREILAKAELLDVYNASIENEELFVIEESGTDLGSYKTKERALEVLDEIQELFIKKDIVKSELNKDGLTMVSMPITCIVYEMPKE